jgi:P4 family phage/plasmid primase-like protien
MIDKNELKLESYKTALRQLVKPCIEHRSAFTYVWENFKNGLSKSTSIESVNGSLRLIKSKFPKELQEVTVESLECKANEILETKELIHFPNSLDMAKHYVESNPLYLDDAGLLWKWSHEEYKWTKQELNDLLNEIVRRYNKETWVQKERTEIINSLKQASRIKKPEEVNGQKCGENKNWVQFKDRIFDFDSGTDFKATPEYFITNPVPWKVGVSEDTPVMDKLFGDWVGKNKIKLLYQVLAYCTLSNLPIHRLFALIGSGRNGKSSFLRIVTKFIGSENCGSSDLHKLMSSDRKFESTRVFKKLVVECGEVSRKDVSNTSGLKRLTGQDSIPVEFKGKNLIDTTSYAKLIIATNTLPKTQDQSDGFYSRWVIINFPNKFTEENNKSEIFKSIPDEEYKNLAKKSLRILKELLDNREFDDEGTIEDKSLLYEEKSNPMKKFLEEAVNQVDDDDRWITKKEFKNKLNEWCKNNNFSRMSDIQIKNDLNDEGINGGRPTETITKKRYSVWLNVHWINPVNPVNPVNPFST